MPCILWCLQHSFAIVVSSFLRYNFNFTLYLTISQRFSVSTLSLEKEIGQGENTIMKEPMSPFHDIHLAFVHWKWFCNAFTYESIFLIHPPPPFLEIKGSHGESLQSLFLLDLEKYEKVRDRGRKSESETVKDWWDEWQNERVTNGREKEDGPALLYVSHAFHTCFLLFVWYFRWNS